MGNYIRRTLITHTYQRGYDMHHVEKNVCLSHSSPHNTTFSDIKSYQIALKQTKLLLFYDENISNTGAYIRIKNPPRAAPNQSIYPDTFESCIKDIYNVNDMAFFTV